ncbi:hypothetical protein AAMO2058_000583100 [Amorphochlora amoebiformis]
MLTTLALVFGFSLAEASAPFHTPPSPPLTVCVTGASGYVASVLIQSLKERGYIVRGTVRDVNKYSEEALFQNVELHRADLLDEGSFDDAFRGCDAVFHCASPFLAKFSDPDMDLIEPAVNGTLNVLKAALKNKVKRVVITSSTAAIGPPQDTQNVPQDKVFNEDDWNTDSTRQNGAYRLSKTLAEKAAWDFSNKTGLEIAVINPSFVIGPPALGRATGVSVETFVNMLNGKLKKSGVRPTCFGCVDVRDVAEGHIRALENKQARGQRFLLSSERGYNPLEFADILRRSKPYTLPHLIQILSYP